MTKQDSNSHKFWMQEDHTLIASALDLIDVPVVLVGKTDEEYTLIATNSRLRHFYEADFSSFHGKKFNDFRELFSDRGKEYLSQAERNYSLCAELGKTVEFEHEYVTPDGETKWSNNSMVPIIEDGEVKRILVTMVDTSYKHEPHDRELTEKSKLIICAWCDSKVKHNHSGTWVGVSEYLHRQGVSQSHAICDDCLNKHSKKLA